VSHTAAAVCDTSIALLKVTQATFKNTLVNPDEHATITVIDKADPEDVVCMQSLITTASQSHTSYTGIEATLPLLQY
jgi:hypothetical protein